MAILKLTMFTALSLRTLAHLARHPGQFVTINAIANANGFSTSHLTKVATELAALGYVETRRGQQGGLRLSVALDEIKFGEVIRRLEDGPDTSVCLQPDICRGHCDCSSTKLIRDAYNAAMEALYAKTFAELLADLERA